MRHIFLFFSTGGDMLAGAGLALAIDHADGRFGYMFGLGIVLAAVSWGFYRATEPTTLAP